MDFLNDAKDFVVKNSNSFFIGAIVVCAVLLGGFGYRYFKTSSEKKAQELFGKAMITYQTGDVNKTFEAFKAVIETHKNSVQASYSAFVLGNLLLGQNKYDEAINWFKEAQSNDPQTGFVGADALEAIAACYEAKGNKQESLEYLQKAMKDDRIRYRFPQLQWKSALIAKDLGKVEEAKKYCEQIIGDTTAQASSFKQKAENFLTEILVLEKS